MSAVLQHFGNRCTEADIERVVAQDTKQRYGIRRDPLTGRLQVRANQGHTFPVDDDGTLHEVVVPGAGFSEVTHGTTPVAWLSIKREGLSRMKRNHIHFIRGRAAPDHPMLPGYRSTSKVLVIVDACRAHLDGIIFYRSQNDVILSPGDERGFISTKYFKQVIDTKTNETLWPVGGDTSSLRIVSPESPVRTLCVGATMIEWKRMKKEGLSRKQKDFIRFSTPEAIDGPEACKSTVLVYVDALKAMAKGIAFYYLNETNDVIVSRGDDRGVISFRFVSRAIDTTTNTALWPVLNR